MLAFWGLAFRSPGRSSGHPMLFATCTAPESYPEQINLQIAAPDTVVVSFITFEPTLCGNGRHSEDEHSSIP